MIAAGYSALRAGLWEEARSAFEAVLESDEDPAALEGLSQAAWWLDDREWSHRCAERAYVRYREEGDRRSAARVGLWLAREYHTVFGPAAGQGWMARAQTLLADAGECPEAGWLALQRSGGAVVEELERAAGFALDIARRCNDAALEAVALGQLGFATEFHEHQGLDMSAVPRMTADDVVTASLRGLELGEVVVAPGVEDASLLDAIFHADLAAFGAQSPQLATRYRAN